MRVAVFLLIMLVAIGYALRKGGGPERAMAAIAAGEGGLPSPSPLLRRDRRQARPRRLQPRHLQRNYRVYHLVL